MSLVQIIENTFFANGRYWGGLNNSLYRKDAIWSMKTGIDSADLNMVWSEKPLAAGDCPTIRFIQDDFRKAGLPFWWWIFPRAQSVQTDTILKNEGYAIIESIPSMIADLAVIPDQNFLHSSLEVIEIKNKRELLLWGDISFRGFEFPPETRKQYDTFVHTFNIQDGSPQKFFLAFLNGEPKATALLFLHQGTGGIYFVTTLLGSRKKGIGLAVTLSAMLTAKRAGAKYCTLQSSPAGFRVYQRAGFQEFCRVNVYSR